jgi:hypothetical protein
MNSLNIDPRNAIDRAPWRRGFLLIPLILAMFGLSATAQAQDGDELNQNTAEGGGALHTYITNATAASFNTHSVLTRSLATQPAAEIRLLARTRS